MHRLQHVFYKFNATSKLRQQMRLKALKSVSALRSFRELFPTPNIAQGTTRSSQRSEFQCRDKIQ